MAMNKSMHPRNRYKDKSPDFVYLASKYPDFQKHVQTTLSGRVMWVNSSPPFITALYKYRCLASGLRRMLLRLIIKIACPVPIL